MTPHPAGAHSPDFACRRCPVEIEHRRGLDKPPTMRGMSTAVSIAGVLAGMILLSSYPLLGLLVCLGFVIYFAGANAGRRNTDG